MKISFTKFFPIFVFILGLLFGLTACDGYVKGAQINSYTSPEEGWYEGKFSVAGGTYTNRFETPSSLSGYEVDVELSVSIESGAMQVSLISTDETRISELVTPDHPIQLRGRSIIDTDAQIYYIPVVFEVSGEGEVIGIVYSLAYVAP